MTDYSTLLREALTHGLPLEPTLAALREVQNLSLAEAKKLVDDSGAWGDLSK